MVMRVLSLTAATSFKSRFLTYLVLFQKIFYLYYLLLGKVQCCTKKVRDFSCEEKKGNLFTKKFFTFHELISTNIISHIYYKKNQIHTTGMYFCNLSTLYADRFAKLNLQNNSLEKEVLIRIASDTNQAVNHNK